MSNEMDFYRLLDINKFSSKPADKRKEIIDNFYSLAKKHSSNKARAKKLKKCGDKFTELDKYLRQKEEKS